MSAKLLKWTLAIALSLALPVAALAAPLKPRIVVLTDISPITAEPDDFESTIRLFVHADLFEIEGLVASTGWSNSGGRERPDLIRQIIDAYNKDVNISGGDSVRATIAVPSDAAGKSIHVICEVTDDGTHPRSGINPNSPGQQEGDTPSSLYLYSAVRGMNGPEKPDQESWGGQSQQRDPAKKHWYDGPGAKSVSKWLPDMQRDFATRLDWCKAPATSN